MDTGPATSSSNTPRTMHRAGQATQGKLDFPFDAITIIMTDSYTGFVFNFVFAFLATVNSFNRRKKKKKKQ